MHNLQELVNPGPGGTMLDRIAQLEAEEARGTSVDQSERVVIVCNSLPLKMRHDPEGSEALDLSITASVYEGLGVLAGAEGIDELAPRFVTPQHCALYSAAHPAPLPQGRLWEWALQKATVEAGEEPLSSWPKV